MDVAYARSWSLGLDLRLLCGRRSQLFRSAERQRHERAGRSTIARRRPRLLGPEPRPQPARAPEAEVVYVCDATAGALERVGRRYPAHPRTTQLRRRCSTTRRVDAVAIATPVSTHYELASRRSRPASTSSSRSRSPARRPRRSQLVELADERGLVLMPGHTFLYSPPVDLIRQLIRVRRARRHLLHLDEPREPRPAPDGRERRLGSRRRTTSRSSATGSARCPSHVARAQPRLRHPRRSRTSRSSTSSSRPGRSPTSSCRGSRRASSGGRRSSARSKMVVYDDTSTEPVRVFDSGVSLRDPETFGEYQLTYRTGDIVSPRIEAAEPLSLEMADFCAAIRDGSDAAVVAESGSTSCGSSRRSMARSSATACAWRWLALKL